MEALRDRAAREGVSVAELVRRAVDAWQRREHAPSAEELKRRALAVAGKFSSGRKDVSERHDEHLGEIYG